MASALRDEYLSAFDAIKVVGRNEGKMKHLWRVLLMMPALSFVSVRMVAAQNDPGLVPPEIVRLEDEHTDGDVRTITMGNDSEHYLLMCHINSTGCIRPESNKNYLLFDKNTRWKMPGAKDFIALNFIQDFVGKYNEGENIGLVPEDPSPNLGMFVLDVAGTRGYEQDTVSMDGPIVYGTDMNHEDRQKAWQNFFLMMLEAARRQQDDRTIEGELTRRCPEGKDCTQMLAAQLIGIGGIKEPRKVIVVVVTDRHDANKQLARIVCTRPAEDVQVCRDWNTGKLRSTER